MPGPYHSGHGGHMTKAQVSLRPSTSADIDYVLSVENDPEHKGLIGSWSQDQHVASMNDPGCFHCIITSDGKPAGYLIAFDLRAMNGSVFIKRIVATKKSKGIGREAIRSLISLLTDPAPKHLYLVVARDNDRARRSYEAVGFKDAPVPEPERACLKQAVGGFSDKPLLMTLKL